MRDPVKCLHVIQLNAYMCDSVKYIHSVHDSVKYIHV